MAPYIQRLIEEQNSRCFYCEHPMVPHQHADRLPLPRDAPTKDHIEPRAYGGPTVARNLVIACSQCNNLRGEIEALAFVNLMQKWFKRDATLHARWHTISREELYVLKQQCLRAHEKQLNGKALRYIEYAFRHISFISRWRKQLQ